MSYIPPCSGALDQPGLRAAFEVLAPGLARFGERHSLTVERYRRGFPIWAFSFRHPKGGAASIQFGLCARHEFGDVEATVQPHWWIDLINEGRRLAASFLTVHLVSPDESGVEQALEYELAAVLGAAASALTRESPLVDRALAAVRGPDFLAPELVRLTLPT